MHPQITSNPLVSKSLRALLPIAQRPIGGQEVNAINARDLHTFLGVGKDFSTWIKDQVDAYGFVEHQDFEIAEVLRSPDSGSAKARTQIAKEYLLSIPMAKELAMVQRTAKGKEARLYFIECERMAQQGTVNPALISRAQLAAMVLDSERERMELACKVDELAPKAAFHDQVASSDDAFTVAEFAKTLGTGETRMFRWLRESGYLIPNTTLPYQRYIDQGLFRVVERTFEDKHGRDRFFTKTLITGKGQVALAKCYRAQGEAQKLRQIEG